MKKNLRLSILIISFSFLIGVIGVRLLLTYREERRFFHNYLKRYLTAPQKFSGLLKEVKVVKLNGNEPTINLSPATWTLLLYFRVDDCLSCLQEVKAIKDTFQLKNLKILIATDHSVEWEIKYILQDFHIEETIWDSAGVLLGSKVRHTPTYFLIKKNKIKDVGIIGPLKEADYREGSFAHSLKERFKKYGI